MDPNIGEAMWRAFKVVVLITAVLCCLCGVAIVLIPEKIVGML
jgi:hypothetical protein